MPSAEDLSSLYVQSWIDPEVHIFETGNMDRGLAAEYVRNIIASSGTNDLSGLTILDFGAGKGALLTALKAAGARAVGVEPYGYKQIQELGLEVFGSIGDLPQNMSFDGIVSMDVIEHIATPWVCLSELRARLKPGGWCIISTPNPEGLNARIFGDKWREARKVGHLVFLRSETLKNMMIKAGFQGASPLTWNVDYRKGALNRVQQCLLTPFGLHGATRVIGRN